MLLFKILVFLGTSDHDDFVPQFNNRCMQDTTLLAGGGLAGDSTIRCREDSATVVIGGVNSAGGNRDNIVAMGTGTDGASMAAAGFLPLSDSDLEERVRVILMGYLKDKESEQNQKRTEDHQTIIYHQQQIFNTYKTEVEGAMREIVQKEVDGFAVTWKADKTAAMEEVATGRMAAGLELQRERAQEREEREKERLERERERDDREMDGKARERQREEWAREGAERIDIIREELETLRLGKL